MDRLVTFAYHRLFFLKQWRYGWPIAVWVVSLMIYYAYIYAYGGIGTGDAASGLRYFLPAAGFFFLGSYGFSYLMGWIEQQRNQWFRSALYLACLGAIFYKLF